jgi:hypothetical protein
MTERDRCKLLFGPYKTPRFRYGQRVFCDVRGWVKIVGLSAGRIPWPKGRRPGQARESAIILFDCLVDAVRRESAQAIRYWWGVGSDTVWKWRKAVDAEPTNEGTRRLKHEHALEPGITEARRKAWSKARDPERRRKIAAAKLGKARPRHVIEAIRKANLGRPLSEEHRRKLSAIHKGRRPVGGWQEWEDKLLETLPTIEVARRTGRTLIAVYCRRQELELPDGRRRRSAARSGCKTPGWTRDA